MLRKKDGRLGKGKIMIMTKKKKIVPRNIKLEQKDIDKYLADKKVFSKSKQHIIDKIDQIIFTICDCFGICGNISWYFEELDEIMGLVGKLPDLSYENVSYCLSLNGMYSNLFSRLVVKNYDYLTSFPSKFLFMTLAEIRKIILEEIETYKVFQEQEKQSAIIENKEKKEALDKLTEKEKKY